MISPAFSYWLMQNGLTEAFSTQGGDTLFVNTAQKIGVLMKQNEYNTRTFYLDDIVELKTFDDENLLVEWTVRTSIQAIPRCTRHSTNEIFILIRLKDQTVLKLQVFHGTRGNISRSDPAHVGLCNHAFHLTQAVRNYALGIS